MKTENFADLVAVISIRKIEAYESIKEKLLFKNAPFSQAKLQNILFGMKNLRFLSRSEKLNKKILPNTPIKKILEDNPEIEITITKELAE